MPTGTCVCGAVAYEVKPVGSRAQWEVPAASLPDLEADGRAEPPKARG